MYTFFLLVMLFIYIYMYLFFLLVWLHVSGIQFPLDLFMDPLPI